MSERPSGRVPTCWHSNCFRDRFWHATVCALMCDAIAKYYFKKTI